VSIDISELRENGIIILRNVIDRTDLDAFKEEYLSYIDNPGKLKVKDHRWSMIRDPLVTCKSIVPLTFSDLQVDIANQYFDWVDTPPAVGTVNLRRSFTYKRGNSKDTTVFHRDPNRPNFIKFFVYLNDVTKDGGPFTFVKGSHKDNKCDKSKYHWTDEQMVKLFGEDNIIHATANYGDLIVCCTFGFHKGLKVKSGTRDMYTVNYVDKPEGEKQEIKDPMSQSNFDLLPEEKRQYARFLKIK